MPATEEIVLRVSGDARGGINALKQMSNALRGLWSDVKKLGDATGLGKVSGMFKSLTGSFRGLGSLAGSAFRGVGKAITGSLLSPLNLVKSALGPIGSAVRGLGGVFQTALGVVAGTAINTLLGSLKELAQAPVLVAARVGVLETVLETVGARAGYTKEQLSGLVEGLKDTGISTKESLGNLTKMIQANLDLSKATDLARVAQDAAVIAGENSSETYEALIHGITTLNPLILRRRGLLVDIQGEIKKYADANGLAAEEVSATMKQQIAFNAVLEAGKNISGAYTAAMGEAGKKAGSLKRYVEEAQLALGKGLLPIYSAAIDITGDVLKGAQSFFEGIQPALTAFSERVGEALTTLYEKGQGAISALSDAFARARPYLEEFGQILGHYLPQVAERLRLLWIGLKGAVGDLASAISGHLPGMATAWTSFTDIVKGAFESVLSILDGFRLLLKGQGEQAAYNFSEAMANGLAVLIIIWEDYVSRALAWGYNLIASFASGIIEGASNLITAAATYVGDLIGNFFAAFSPPKAGPLAGILKWGQGLINTYFQGFAKADFGLLRQTGDLIKGALQSAVSLGDLPEKELIPMFSKVREQTAGLIAHFRKTGEISEEALGKISTTLGAGSEDLVKYLRLQLQHQKAVKELAGVEEEYAAAEAKGFIPAELKKRLDAAKARVDEAQDELSWQEELVRAQQETVDLQAEQMNVMKKLAEAVDKVGGAVGKLGTTMKALKGPEAPLDALAEAQEALLGAKPGAITAPEVKGLALPKLDASTMKADIDAGLKEAFSGVSDRFAEAKEKARELMGFFTTGAKEKLAELPGIIKEKLAEAFAAFREIPAVDTLISTVSTIAETIGATVGSVIDVLSSTTLPKLKEAFATLTETLAMFGLDWSDVWGALGQSTIIVIKILGYLLVGLVGVVVGVVNGIASALQTLTGAWQKLLTGIKLIIEGAGHIFGGFKELVAGILTGDLPRAWNGFLNILKGGVKIWKGLWKEIEASFQMTVGVLISLVMGMVEGIIEFFRDLYNRLVGGSIIPEMVEAIIRWIEDFANRVLDKIREMVQSVIDKFTELKDRAIALIEQLRSMIQAKVDQIRSYFESLKKAISDILSKMAGLLDLGDAFDRIKDAIGEVAAKVVEFAAALVSAVIPQWPFRLADAFGGIKESIGETVGKLSEMLGLLADAVLPDWLLPGSATPFEIGLRGIAEVLEDLPNLTARWMAGFSGGGLSPVMAGVGHTYQFYFGEGAFAGAFPGVRDGRDAQDFMRELNSLIEQASARVGVPGGLA